MFGKKVEKTEVVVIEEGKKAEIEERKAKVKKFLLTCGTTVLMGALYAAAGYAATTGCKAIFENKHNDNQIE